MVFHHYLDFFVCLFCSFLSFSRMAEIRNCKWKRYFIISNTDIQISLKSVKSEMPKESSLWKPYKYIQRWWVPYGSDKWNPLLWFSSSLKQNTLGWIWCSWNKALIAWPNNTLNPLPSRHFKLCQIGFGMWTNILEPDSHTHRHYSLEVSWILLETALTLSGHRDPKSLKERTLFKLKTSHSFQVKPK